MKILIISNTFFPNNDPRSLRTTALAKEFSKTGHQVTVLTPKKANIHPQFEIKNKLKIIDLGASRFKDIDCFKGSKPVIFIKRILRRALGLFFDYPYIEWMFKVKKALKKESGYNLLISIAHPHGIHWGAAWAWREKNKIASTWIADCGDPFMGSENDSFNKLFYFKYLEKNWGRKVDYITIPIEEARTAYYSEFQNKIRIIPQGFSFPALLPRRIQKNKPVVFLYSGNIGSYSHNYKPFFDFLNKIENDFIFKVYTKEESIYRKHLKSILNKVEIHSYIEREELIQEMRNADFLIHFPYRKHSQKSLKLIDYSYSGTPILSYKGKQDTKLFQQFLKGNYEGQLPGENIEPYKIENVCKQFLKLVDGGKI